MKKYLVIGNPIEHSLSPKLHNHWLRVNNIDAIYEKKLVTEVDLQEIINQVRKDKIAGINVTVPFKKDVISHLDKLTLDAEATQSVNTILLTNDKVIGHNTDISGFKNAIKDTKYNFVGKKILILGAGGVVPSIIFALYKMKVFSVTLSNRTKIKAENLKNYYNATTVDWNKITVVDWGEIPDFDMVINATSVGLKNDQKLDLDFSKIEKGKFFYDVIYNPKETNFLRAAKQLGNEIENGKKMFIYQAQLSFKIWHNILPKIDSEIINLLND